MSEVKFKLAAGTNVGLLRQNNEDNFVVSPDLAAAQWLLPKDDEYVELGQYGALLVVADGMGGMNAGEVASAIAVETVQQMFTPDNIAPVVDDSKAVQEFMEGVAKTADLNILNRSREDSSTQGMGTTIVMAWILGQRAYITWCGDSRCYVYNKKRGLRRLSKDHSFVQELVDKGELAPEYTNDHPLSNVITRCLGNEEKRAEPETRVYELYSGDAIMLCSDGLCGLCRDDHIAEVMEEFKDNAQECRNELISAALSMGGHDNVTVALCTVLLDRTEDDAPSLEDDKEDEAFEEIPEDSDSQAAGDDEATPESGEQQEELANTLRNTPPRKRHTLLWTFLILLLLVAVACYFYWYYNQETVTPIIQDVMKKIHLK